MATIKIVVNGATGRMGTETITAICRQDDLELVGLGIYASGKCNTGYLRVVNQHHRPD